MKRQEIWKNIEQAISADKRANKHWPDHAVAQAGKVAASAGELVKSTISIKYKSSVTKQEETITPEQAAVNTAVQAIRFLENYN